MGVETGMEWDKGKIARCYIGSCSKAGAGTQFGTFEDLSYHIQDVHGAGYYKRPEPAGYYERNPGEKDRKAERKNGG